MNIRLLKFLQDSGAFVPLAALGDNPEAVRRDLDELQMFGFELENHPYLGVAYRGPASRLCPDQIEWELGTSRIGRRIAVWNRVASTNDLAARAAESRSNDGLVILAEEQTAGRGRLGRTWTAPPGSSLLLSALIFPTGLLAAPRWLTALGAVAVARVAEAATEKRVAIKWPNDVRVDGRKVAGILVERGLGAVIGIGLNVNVSEFEMNESLKTTATSFRILQNRLFDRSELARELIRQLDGIYMEGLARGPEPLLREWTERLEPVIRGQISMGGTGSCSP